MILDTEEQRQNLLQLIRMAPIQGPFEQVGPIIAAIEKLKSEIEEATLYATINKPKAESSDIEVFESSSYLEKS